MEGANDVAWAYRTADGGVGGMVRAEGSDGELFAQHRELVSYWKGLTFGMDMVDTAHLY